MRSTHLAPGHLAFLVMTGFLAGLGVTVFILNQLWLDQSDSRIATLYAVSAVSGAFFAYNFWSLKPWSIVLFYVLLVGGFSADLALTGGNLRFPAFPIFYVVFLACAMTTPPAGIALMSASLLGSISYFAYVEAANGSPQMPLTNAIISTHIMTFLLVVSVGLASSRNRVKLERALNSEERQRQFAESARDDAIRAQKDSEAKKAEAIETAKRLQISQDRLSLATQQVCVWDWDVVQDKLYLSPSFAKMLGYSSQQELDEARSRSFADLLHPDDVDQYLAALNNHFTNPIQPFRSEHRFKHKAGGYIRALALGYSECSEDGEVTRFLGVSTDVTERHELTEQLRQAQKMEAIGKIAGGMAHDFNNILAVILGNLELLNDLDNELEKSATLESAKDAAMRGADLISSLLSFARRSQLSPQALDINHVVMEFSNWFATGIPENIETEIKLAEGLPGVQADPAQMQAAIMNLVVNARDAMPDGGRLEIRTLHQSLDTQIIDANGNAIPKGDYAVIQVADTGHGIPDSAIDRVFEPFYSTKPEGMGSGLGLSMVFGFMRQSGGAITFSSKRQRGSEFNLYFPSLHQSVPMDMSSPDTNSLSTTGKVRVLVVEDQMDVLGVLIKRLELAGFNVTSATSGEEALSIWEKEPNFDLLITDIVLPGEIQGTDLIEKVRSISPDVPVISLTGYFDQIESTDLVRQDREIRLMKPVPKEQLLKAIEKILQTAKAGTKTG